MPKVTQFSVPGNQKDFKADLAAKWSSKISGMLDAELTNLQVNPGLLPQFYNASKLDVAGEATPISWPAFPQIVEIKYGDDEVEMFRQAESRTNQDEYLEWATIQDGKKIVKVMFTSESPEYWKFIADNDSDLLVALYSKIVGQSVPKQDLFTSGGAYRPSNKWNAAHAIHLVQVNNTLAAEINIAAQATVLRRHNGTDPVTDANELINCSGFGAAERHSDPHIGDEVNKAARTGRSITLQDPIALYIASLPHPTNDLGIKKPGGGVVGMDYWALARGDADHILRAVFAAPVGQPAVGDLEIGTQKITSGGQIVKSGIGLRVKLTGVVGKAGVFHNHTYPCPGESPLAFAAVGLTTTARRR